MTEKEKKLYLVSTGIGDADNITLRAHKLILHADLVFAMDFVREKFADLLKDKTVYPAGHGFFMQHSMNSAKPGEEDRCRKLIRTAISEGKTVVVLDFGDPTIYSPQAGYLTEFHDLNPQIIPGISSFNAANAVLAQPLNGPGDLPVILTDSILEHPHQQARLAQLAAAGATMVFFTMRMDIERLVELLKKHYRDTTPVSIVCHAGIVETQKVLQGTLDTIVELIQEMSLPWENLLYVGDFMSPACDH